MLNLILFIMTVLILVQCTVILFFTLKHFVNDRKATDSLIKMAEKITESHEKTIDRQEKMTTILMTVANEQLRVYQQHNKNKNKE
jgi:hypothetical protein